jgi:ribonuclease HI
LNHVFVYTDGACLGNPGPGGSGYLVVHGSCGRHDSGSEQNTIKNRMELRAAIEALNSLPDACTVTLFSDRRYLITGMTTLVPRWQERAWRSSNGTVQNQGAMARIVARRRDVTNSLGAGFPATLVSRKKKRSTGWPVKLRSKSLDFVRIVFLPSARC